MLSNTVIALFAALGAAIFVYRKTARRGGGDFKKEIGPSLIAFILAFLIALTIIAQIN